MKILFTAILLMVFAVAAVAQHAAAPKVYTELIASSEKTLKGAPFSAEAVNESVQILADGNRIVRRSTTKMYRDSEGRYRREGSPAVGGAAGSYITSVGTSISDPVGGFRYVLMDSDKSARRMPLGLAFSGQGSNITLLTTTNKAAQAELAAAGSARQAGTINTGNGVTVITTDPAKHAAAVKLETETALLAKSAPTVVGATITPGEHGTIVHTGSGFYTTSATNTETESLGTRDFHGVNADGTRTVTKIPAGTIGNEREIEVIYERWYSKDLQMIVYSKHSDPRYGDQTYSLTSLSRAEPDSSLFTVPADYKIRTENSAAGTLFTTTVKGQGATGGTLAPAKATAPKKEQ